ncbi:MULTISPECIES: SH3 domain-containing protein [unclassified Streptomyces]|uniref:SH3 domain-containing protein n=1 Tax=unclassified Streptomyces TaxID=2593676 RepID=UPI00278BB856|nr:MULTISPECIES: SH3 domain-containing protein [unclassified Streptomyces]
MKRRIAAVLPAIAMVAVSFPIAMSGSAAAAAACGKTASDKDSSSWGKTANGANERTGSSTSCTSKGIAYSSHTLDYHCYTRAGDYTWTYLRNDTTGVTGWVRDDLLSDGGSLDYCGF